MKSNTKSSITLPPLELKLVERLKKELRAKSNVEVIRRGLHLLTEQHDREILRASYQTASLQARDVTKSELEDLDSLSDEGLD